MSEKEKNKWDSIICNSVITLVLILSISAVIMDAIAYYELSKFDKINQQINRTLRTLEADSKK